MILFGRRAPRFVFLIAALLSSAGIADETPSRFSAGGYFRIQARPDFQGGNGGLGIWNLYGRLLNEGPYAMLQSQLQLIQADPNGSDPYANVNVRIEGGFLQFSQAGGDNLQNFRISQFYLTVGNVALNHVTWQVGSLYYYPGDLGLYDFRPAQILEDAVGLSATWHGDKLDLLIGAGDSGYGLHGSAYDTVYTVGGFARWKPLRNVELGIGGHFLYEPGNLGNPNSPYATPNVDYADYFRKDVLAQYVLNNPQDNMATMFPKPSPRSDVSWRAVAYLGFGDLGPIQWSSLYGHVERLMPLTYYADTYTDMSNHTFTKNIYLHDLTDQRYDVQIGNEMQITLVPKRLDVAWGVVYGMDINNANKIAAGEDNRWYASTVVRLQAYATNTVHFLLESSLAHEKSMNGNLWREHFDSIFQSTTGTVSDTTGFAFGDADHRDTWQGKLGVIFNPAGRGIYMRPSLRLLYGLQYSNMQAAFGNSFQTSLAQDNQFPPDERHWHQVVAVEAEGWF